MFDTWTKFITIALPLPSTGLLYLSSTTSTLITRRSQEIWFLLEELRFFPSHLSHWQNKVHLFLLHEFTFFQTYHCLLCNHSVRHFCNALGQVGGREGDCNNFKWLRIPIPSWLLKARSIVLQTVWRITNVTSLTAPPWIPVLIPHCVFDRYVRWKKKLNHFSEFSGPELLQLLVLLKCYLTKPTLNSKSDIGGKWQNSPELCSSKCVPWQLSFAYGQQGNLIFCTNNS